MGCGKSVVMCAHVRRSATDSIEVVTPVSRGDYTVCYSYLVSEDHKYENYLMLVCCFFDVCLIINIMQEVFYSTTDFILRYRQCDRRNSGAERFNRNTSKDG